MTFNGFISYSHAADGRLAPAVQRGLHRLARPWHRRRALWIFRDQTGLSVTPALWSSIQDALDGSDYFVLLASPEAARSPWVNREIDHWTATKSADRILPVVTDGEWAWDRITQDFTAESTAVPAALRGVFSEEPLFLDLRWARGDEQLSLHHSRFRDAIAQLAAPMHGVSKDDLEGEDVRQHRRARRLQWGAVATMLILTMLASVTGALAVQNAVRANASAQEARHQQQAADEQRDSATRYATEAQHQQALAAQQQARAADAAGEAQRQQALADSAEADAAVQSREAGRQKANALRQQKLADRATRRTKQQQQLAKESAAQAATAAAEAKRMTQAAQEQQKRAKAAAAEAARQQATAEQQQRIAISRRLLNQSRAAVANDPATALKLGAAAQTIQPGPDTRSELAGVVSSTHFAGSINDVTAVASAPDGALATMNSDGSISLWDVGDRTRPVRLSTLAEGSIVDGPIELSPDGRTLAMSTGRLRVDLWDVSDRSRPVRLGELPTSGAVYSFAFSPDNHAFAAGQYGGQTTLWDVTDRTRATLTATLAGGVSEHVDRVGFSADGRTVTEIKEGLVSFWNVTDPAQPVPLAAPPLQAASSVAFSPHAPVLATGQDGGVNLWDLTALNPPGVEEPVSPEPGSAPAAPASVVQQIGRMSGLAPTVGFLGYSSDGRRMVGADEDGTVLTWDSTNPARPRVLGAVKTLGQIRSAGFTPDDQTLITVDSSATATLWNVASTGDPDLVAALTDPLDSVLSSAFSPDGRSFAVAREDGTADFWNLTSPAHPARVAGPVVHNGAVTSVAFSPDRHTVAAAGAGGGQVTLTDVTNPSAPVTLAVIDQDPEMKYAVGFSPDGRILAIAADAGPLTLWSLADRRHPRLLSTTGSTSRLGPMVAFSPDGRTLAVGSGRRGLALFRVADPAAPVYLTTLAGHGASVVAVAFSPDGHTLASASADHTAILWDVTDVAGPHRLTTLDGDGASLSSVAFSPDGRTLAVASGSGTLNAVLWDVADRAVPIRLATVRNAADGRTTPVSFGPDGHTLAVAGTLWNYRELNNVRADPAKYACVITGRGLTRAEWSSFIPELPYRRTCPA